VHIISTPNKDAPASRNDDALSPSESSLVVIRDIYYMKRIAVEVVSQLALDTISTNPNDSFLFSQLVEQAQEEFEHLNQCRLLLAEFDAFAETPSYVRQYARMMRSCASKSRRTLSLAAAAILCIAVERAAMRQLAGEHASGNRRVLELLRQLAADEEDHYRLVVQVVAPNAASRASALERLRTHILILEILWITLVRWWPRRLAAYEACGLNVTLFLEATMEYASQALRPLGLMFPDKVILSLARRALRVSSNGSVQ
jgi:hypothetical protein